MPDWKELGEVPDSEDEDAYESQQSLPAASLGTASAAVPAKDIWTFESSQDGPSLEPRQALEKLTPSNRNARSNIWDIPSSPPQCVSTPDSGENAVAAQRLGETDPHEPLSSSPLSTISSILFDDTLPIPRDYQASDVFPQSRSLTPLPSRTSKTGSQLGLNANQLASTQSTPRISSELGEQSDQQLARQVAVRYERRLRARKPIQEHPFLYEQAQYSTTMRTHGLKPVRSGIQEQYKRSEQRPRDRQVDKEYSEPDSDGSQSQPHSSAIFDSDIERLPFDFSSPATSPRVQRAGTGSQPSSRKNTVARTRQVDHDDDLLPIAFESTPGTSKGSGQAPKRKPSSPRVSNANKRRSVLAASPSQTANANANANQFHGQSPTVFPSSPSLPDIPNFMEILGVSKSKSAPTPTAAQSAVRSRTSESPTPAKELVSPTSVTAPITAGFKRTTPARRSLLVSSDSDTDIEEPATAVSESPAQIASESSAESEADEQHDALQAEKRRIRGVLPASWLRLDQKAGRDKLRKTAAHSRAQQVPETEPRRGVAVRKPRAATDQTVVDRAFWFDDLEGDEDVELGPTSHDEPQVQRTLQLIRQPAPSTVPGDWSSDDDSSQIAMEDNQVDHMLAPRKRQLKLVDSFAGTLTNKKIRQGITRTTSSSLPVSKASVSRSQPSHPRQSRNSLEGWARPKNQGKTRKHPSPREIPRNVARSAHRPTQPPRLGILDVIEEGAPRFLRIAARQAKQRYNQGRSSPSRKVFKFATREDQIDALTVVQNWKSGQIRPRPLQQPKRRTEPAQAPRSSKIIRATTVAGSTPSTRANGAPLKLTRSLRDDGTATIDLVGPVPKTVPYIKKPLSNAANRATTSRPALLETAGSDEVSRRTFNARKRALDRLFHKYPTVAAEQSIVPFISENKEDSSMVPAVGTGRQLPSSEPANGAQGSARRPYRKRKQQRPTHIDVDEPQYSRAGDPIPNPIVQNPEPLKADKQSTIKLQGLGPFGTQYTHHFEVFPLDGSVYFHESTLIGSGMLQVILDNRGPDSMSTSMARSTYTLGDSTLVWNTWSPQVSSEIGIVLDHIAERLEDATGDTASVLLPTKKAADFVLFYIVSQTAHDGIDLKAFVLRFHDVLRGFMDRVPSSTHRQPALRVLERLFLASARLFLYCQSQPSLSSEQFQIEELLKTIASTLMSVLVKIGTVELGQTYRHLRLRHFREAGMREDSSTMHSWTVLAKVLDRLRLRGASFWDLLQGELILPLSAGPPDAAELEKCWESLFALLPISEINEQGLVVSGQRHRSSEDGWVIVQKLLKPIFQVYQADHRQPAVFNSYCRALLARCHYLVEQWGWRRSASVVGAIFDFFGTQDLAHLRNEEVFGSPAFLENLARNPSLKVTDNDKCFHIFLKLVALSIHQLRDVSATKDVRNLVARIMPNHDRQYSKEQAIHATDLAALRNHHDLLCTLFWACAPEERPSAHRIELLVDPVSSHREACVISLRAWSQLTRFIVSNGEAPNSIKPFKTWMSTFFDEQVRQYDTIASDINLQLHALSQNDRQEVSSDMVKEMIEANQSATQAVIRQCVHASHVVMQECPDLAAATFALNHDQLAKTFDRFASGTLEWDWTLLGIALETLDSFVAHVDLFKEAEESQVNESQLLDSEEADDALMGLDRFIAPSFFAMARSVLASPHACRSSDGSKRRACRDTILRISARLTAHFTRCGVMSLSSLFTNGKYSLFDALPHRLDLEQRMCLVVCVAALLRAGMGVDDFSDCGFSLMDLWAISTVKPQGSLAGVDDLAEQLVNRDQHYLSHTSPGSTIKLDYATNALRFEHLVAYMRNTLRTAGPSEKKLLLSEYAKTLNMVMEQMKTDLQLLSSDNMEHSAYVSFVRNIVSLVKSHGADICKVHSFYFQVTKDYSPPSQDPHLQVATMLSYGLRLEDKDAAGRSAQQQLFFFLYNNFKVALSNGKLTDETTMLMKGMRTPSLRRFVVGKMLPAAIRAAWQNPAACTIVNTYTAALEGLLAESTLPVQLRTEDTADVVTLLKSFRLGLLHLSESHDSSLAAMDRLDLVEQTLAIANLLWPSLQVLFLSSGVEAETNILKPILVDIRDCLDMADALLRGRITEEDQDYARASIAQNMNQDRTKDGELVTSFTKHIVADIRNDWIVEGRVVSIKIPATGQSTQSATQSQGRVMLPERDQYGTGVALEQGIAEWKHWYACVFTPTERPHMSKISEAAFF